MNFDGQRESATVPWDVIVNRLDRYLRLAYASAVLAGFVLAAEITVLAIPGSPNHRRAEIADAATSVSDWDLSTPILLVAVVATLIAAYFIGLTARVLTFAVVFALVNAINLVRAELRSWWRGDFEPPRVEESEFAERGPRSRWEDMLRSVSRARQRRGPPDAPSRVWQALKRLGASVGRSLSQPFLPYVVRQKDLWLTLDWMYGADKVNRMLDRHPLKVRVDVADRSSWNRPERERAREAAELQVTAAREYCQLWLQRYAPDVAIPPRATRALILGTAALPAALLPPSLHRVGEDVGWISSLVGPLRILLLLGALVLFVGVLREVAGQAAAMFQRFVVVELAEQVRGGASGATTTAQSAPGS